jgi:hypothetical protein
MSRYEGQMSYSAPWKRQGLAGTVVERRVTRPEGKRKRNRIEVDEREDEDEGGPAAFIGLGTREGKPRHAGCSKFEGILWRSTGANSDAGHPSFSLHGECDAAGVGDGDQQLQSMATLSKPPSSLFLTFILVESVWHISSPHSWAGPCPPQVQI